MAGVLLGKPAPSCRRNKTKIEGKLHDLQQARTSTWMSKCLETENKQVAQQLWIYLSHLLWITALEWTLETWATGGEEVTQLFIHLWLRCLVCHSEEEENYWNIPQGCEWGWGSPTATDKDLDRESPGVRTHLDLRPGFGPAQSSTVSQVTMGCNMCVVQKPEEQYRVMFQVSNASYHLSLSVCATSLMFFVALSNCGPFPKRCCWSERQSKQPRITGHASTSGCWHTNYSQN